MNRMLLTGLLTLGWVGTAWANPIQCRFAELVRDIEVVYAYPGQAVPCEVIYRKSMESSVQTLWRAYAEEGYCEARAQQLADTLSASGWQCLSVAAEILAADPAESTIDDSPTADPDPQAAPHTESQDPAGP